MGQAQEEQLDTDSSVFRKGAEWLQNLDFRG
jgi:hypothetical protein